MEIYGKSTARFYKTYGVRLWHILHTRTVERTDSYTALSRAADYFSDIEGNTFISAQPFMHMADTENTVYREEDHIRSLYGY